MSHNRNIESLLLAYYGNLLTDHQRNILEEYYYEDLSMNEIADNFSISKSAVQDLIKRTLKQLNEYESSLKLIEKDEKINEVIEELYNYKDKNIKILADKLKNITKGE